LVALLKLYLLIFYGTPVLLRHLLKQDAKSRTSGAGFIDMLRINSNPPSADFADAQSTRGGFRLRLNLWPTDSKIRNLRIQKGRDFNRLNLFNFFNQLLVSFGNVWKYLILTDTFWAQFNFL
jgi:hypothetical protein